MKLKKSIFVIHLSLTITLLKFLKLCAAENQTILDNFTWECANNASCVNMVARNVLNRYQRKEQIDFGLFSVKRLSDISSSSNINGNSASVNKGRSSLSPFMDFLNGNVIRVPIGPMVFSVQRSDDSNYLEVALLRKVQAENGRRQGGGGGGMKEKKHMQMYIPMYLAATTFGWTLTAIKAVGVISIKALIVSKLALIIAAALIIKKLMENAAEKMYIPHYPEHHHEHPYVLPYNMEFAHLPHTALSGADINPHDFYSLHLGHPHDLQQSGAENIAAAESSVSHSVQLQNSSQPQITATLNGVAYPKVKRDDRHQHRISTWNGIKPKSSVYNYVAPANNPIYVYPKF